MMAGDFMLFQMDDADRAGLDYSLAGREERVMARRKRQVHELKVWDTYYDDLISGTKPFEIRRNDRDFQIGDLLFFREWDADRDAYTGLEALGRVGYVYDGVAVGLKDGFTAFTVTELAELSNKWADEYAELVPSGDTDGC
jgi:hypothetical protein